jgi:S1-C subfamily serine protease
MHRSFKQLFSLAAVLFLLAAMPASSAFAQKMHRWVDEDGQVHFSQTPPPDQGRQESEMVTYGEEERNDVDRACCGDVRELAGVAATYLQRGLTLTQLQQEFPPSEYPYVTEIFNFASFNAAGGDSPAAIGSRAFTTCLNRGFQACRIDGGSAGVDGGVVASSGSGVVIGEGLVITNDHVVRACGEVAVSDAQVSARVLARDSGTDLAVLQASLEGLQPAAWTAAARPRLGQSIVVAGFPLSDVLASLNFTTGTVSSENAIRGSNTLFQITAPIQPGNSGGPVFDSGGRLVGIVVSKLAELPVLRDQASLPQNVNFAITPMAVKAFLRQNDIPFLESASTASYATEAIAERAKRNTVRVFCYP